MILAYTLVVTQATTHNTQLKIERKHKWKQSEEKEKKRTEQRMRESILLDEVAHLSIELMLSFLCRQPFKIVHKV